MRSQYLRLAVFAVAVSFAGAARAQAPSASTQGPVRITLDEALQMPLAHNSNLKAARTTIQQSEATEITANLRPNPILTADAQFLPIFQPDKFSADYINTTHTNNSANKQHNQTPVCHRVVFFFCGRGGKRQHRLRAPRDVTAQTR